MLGFSAYFGLDKAGTSRAGGRLLFRSGTPRTSLQRRDESESGGSWVSGAEYDQLQGIFGVRMRVVRMQLGDGQIELTDYVTSRGRPAPVDACLVLLMVGSIGFSLKWGASFHTAKQAGRDFNVLLLTMALATALTGRGRSGEDRVRASAGVP